MRWSELQRVGARTNILLVIKYRGNILSPIKYWSALQCVGARTNILLVIKYCQDIPRKNQHVGSFAISPPLFYI
jgi:hypothetical protein